MWRPELGQAACLTGLDCSTHLQVSGHSVGHVRLDLSIYQNMNELDLGADSLGDLGLLLWNCSTLQFVG